MSKCVSEYMMDWTGRDRVGTGGFAGWHHDMRVLFGQEMEIALP